MGTSGTVVNPAAGRPVRGSACAGVEEREEGLDLFLRRRNTSLVRLLGDGGNHNGSIKNLSVGSAIEGTARADDFWVQKWESMIMIGSVVHTNPS